MVLMVKGNTETYVDELQVEEMQEKGYKVIDLDPKKEDKKETKKEK